MCHFFLPAVSGNLLRPNVPLFSTWSLAICLDPMCPYFLPGVWQSGWTLCAIIFYLESGNLVGPNAQLFSTWSLASCLDPMTSLALRKGSKKTVSLAGPRCFLQQGIVPSSASKGCFVTIHYQSWADANVLASSRLCVPDAKAF